MELRYGKMRYGNFGNIFCIKQSAMYIHTPITVLLALVTIILISCSNPAQPSHESPETTPDTTIQKAGSTPIANTEVYPSIETDKPPHIEWEITTPTTKSASQNDFKLNQHYLRSIEECLNRVLGTELTEQILAENHEPSSQETIAINECSKPRDEGQSDRGRNQSNAGKGRSPNDQNTRVSERGQWSISPTQTACLFKAIGKSTYRDIYNGVRLPTPTEVKTTQTCLPGSKSLNDIPHPLSVEQCPSLEILERNIEAYQPRWDQLDCHMEGLNRLPLPSFRTSARINPVVMMEPPEAEIGCQGLLCPQGTKGLVIKDIWDGDLDVLLESMKAESWEEFAGGRYTGSRLDHLTSLQFTEAEFPLANFTYLPGNVFRPKTEELGERHVFPVTDYWHDVGLRAFAVHVILRKRAGHITPMEFGFGGSKDIPEAKTPEEFRHWIDEFFIPQKIYEAKIAERLKMETYKPWMSEIDVWVMDQSWALEASDQELLETGQYLLDSVVAAVRPHFNGRITPHTWQHGSAVHEAHPRPIWKDLTFKGHDEVGVTFFPRCDLETTMADARVQFEAIMEMVKRDSIPWVISEMDTNHRGFEYCETDMLDQADEIWTAVLDLINELEVQPVGISTKGFGNIYSNEHKNILEEKVFSRSGN